MSEEGGRRKKKKKADEGTILWSELQYHCDYCRKDISNTVRIRCAECQEFDLCLECFSVGVELDDHKNDHNFRIIDNMQFPLLTRDWSADEEMLLLEGLEMLGYGNWEDVSEHITTKNKDEVREHYKKIYLDSPYWPHADLSRLYSVREDVKRYNSNPALLDEVAPRNRGPKRSSTKVILKKPQPSRPVRTDLSNFMPLRGEFEVEWDNDAENSIKDLTFDPDDCEEERESKARLLELYNERLDDRYEKRQFVLERNLHVMKNRENEKKRTREEKEVYNKVKKFMKMMDMDEYYRFIDDLLEEKKLKQRIKDLQEYRRNGIRTFAEVELFKNERLYSDTPKRGRPLGSGKKQMELARSKSRA